MLYSCTRMATVGVKGLITAGLLGVSQCVHQAVKVSTALTLSNPQLLSCEQVDCFEPVVVVVRVQFDDGSSAASDRRRRRR